MCVTHAHFCYDLHMRISVMIYTCFQQRAQKCESSVYIFKGLVPRVTPLATLQSVVIRRVWTGVLPRNQSLKHKQSG